MLSNRLVIPNPQREWSRISIGLIFPLFDAIVLQSSMRTLQRSKRISQMLDTIDAVVYSNCLWSPCYLVQQTSHKSKTFLTINKIASISLHHCIALSNIYLIMTTGLSWTVYYQIFSHVMRANVILSNIIATNNLYVTSLNRRGGHEVYYGNTGVKISANETDMPTFENRK